MTLGSFVHDAKPRSQTTATATPIVGSQAGQAQRAIADPAALTPADVRILQRTIGNRAVQRLLRNTVPSAPVQVQPRLRVRPLRDPLEAEAERSADKIVNSSMGDKNSRASVGLTGTIQTKQTDLQSNHNGAPADPAVAQGIQRARGRGQPLVDGVRAKLEQRMGADFGGVRIHTDAGADTLNRALDARAFTSGRDIFFKEGEYQRDNRSAQKLLAHELVHVQQQSGAGGTGGATIQRKANKLPHKVALTHEAKSMKLYGTTMYTKIMRAIDHYHTKVDNTDYLAQLQQLITIHHLLTQWQVSHGATDTDTTSKNKGERDRRALLHSLRTDYLPNEVAEVYQQTKNAGINPDISMLMELMDLMQGDMTHAAAIMGDYGRALHTYTATNQDTQSGKQTLTGTGSTIQKAIKSVETHEHKFKDLQNIDAELDVPIDKGDSNFAEKIKKERKKRLAFRPAMQRMNDVEYMAIAAYTQENGYTPMNKLLRGGMSMISGKDKEARQAHLTKRKEVQQTNLMAVSALNRLPNWDGSTVYRGEDISWGLGQIQNGAIITLKAFTSTTADERFAREMALGRDEGAVWEIHGITHAGKDISRFTIHKQKNFLDPNDNDVTEDEVLLKPFTRLKIISMTQTDGSQGYKWRIVAQQQT